MFSHSVSVLTSKSRATTSAVCFYKAQAQIILLCCFLEKLLLLSCLSVVSLVRFPFYLSAFTFVFAAFMNSISSHFMRFNQLVF